MKGRFTFNDNQKFKTIINLLDQPDIRTIALDFSHVDFIDSAALGMLLLLRDEAQKQDIRISLQNPNGQIQKIFELTKINQLFLS
jgi:anti-anti-sigma factor